MIRNINNKLKNIYNKESKWQLRDLQSDEDSNSVYKTFLKNKRIKNGIKLCLLCCYPQYSKHNITICQNCNSNNTVTFYRNNINKYKRFSMSLHNLRRIKQINQLIQFKFKNSKKLYCNQCMNYTRTSKNYEGCDFKCKFCVNINSKINETFGKKLSLIEKSNNNIFFYKIIKGYLLLMKILNNDLVKYINHFKPNNQVINLIQKANYYQINIPIFRDFKYYPTPNIKLLETNINKKGDYDVIVYNRHYDILDDRYYNT